MTIDKDGLAPCPLCAAQMLLERFVDWESQPLNVQHIVHPTPTTCPLAGVQIEASTEAIAAWNRRALPNTGDELVAPETVAWRYAESDVEWGTTTEAAKAGRLSEIVPVEPLIRLVDHQSAIRANAAAAEASLASAREALDWYADRVGLAGAMTAEGAKARAELAQDNGARALKELR